MKWHVLMLVLGGCTASRTSTTSADPAPGMATPPSNAKPSAAASAAAPEHHDHHAGHGKAGYHMDFSEVERFARHFDGPERDAWQKPNDVVRFLRIDGGEVVADIGAGTGYFLPHLSKAVGARGRVLALDVEPNMVEYMKQRCRRGALSNVEPRVVTADDPGLAAASVDRILIVDTWHHIDDRANYSRKLAQALRPTGELLIVDFTLDSDLGPPKEHRLSAERVMKELQEGGLRAELVREETLPKQYVVRGSPR